MDFTGKPTVFVYGTLMKGFGNERVIKEFPHKNFPAVIDHVDMYNVGAFPAIVKGTHSYSGELVVFDESVDEDYLFSSMDLLEGYIEKNKLVSLYLRENVIVFVDGHPVETQVYYWNRSVDDLTFIDPAVYPGYKDYCFRNK